MLVNSLHRVRNEITDELVEFEANGKPSGNAKAVFKTDAEARKAATEYAETQQTVVVAKLISNLCDCEISEDPKEIQKHYGGIVDRLRAAEGAAAVQLFNALRETGLLTGKMRS